MIKQKSNFELITESPESLTDWFEEALIDHDVFSELNKQQLIDYFNYKRSST